jgi:hypothetical protein
MPRIANHWWQLASGAVMPSYAPNQPTTQPRNRGPCLDATMGHEPVPAVLAGGNPPIGIHHYQPFHTRFAST